MIAINRHLIGTEYVAMFNMSKNEREKNEINIF